MSDSQEENRPIEPQRPKHVPFWPVLIGIAFMVAVVVAGLISSNKARENPTAVSTSTLPKKGAPTTSSSTTPATALGGSRKTTSMLPTVTTVPATTLSSTPDSDACTSTNLVKAAIASGKVDVNALGSITAPQFKCVAGYALARLVPAKGGQSVTADYQLQANKTWKMLNLGDVNPPDDGVPTDIASELVLR